MIDLLEKFLIILDIECTTWKGAVKRDWSKVGEHREVVQIAAVLIETKEFMELSIFQSLVLPKINSTLSDYFINLTKITQQEVDQHGTNFRTMLERFHDWCSNFDIYSFDNRLDGSRLFDRDVLIENCEILNIEFPFKIKRFHNINELFNQHGYIVKQSGTSPEVFGLEVPDRPHNALNDVRGLIISLKELRRLEKI